MKKKSNAKASKKYYDSHRTQRIKETQARRKTPTGRYTMYKTTAKRRGLEFLITLEEFTSLISKNCTYCGSNDSVGVDRIDNQIGYLIENSTSCCTTCNMMKKALPLELFLEHCQKVTLFNT